MADTAVVRIADIQYRVSENQVLRIPRVEGDVGASLEFDQVLLVGGEEPRVGTPIVEGAMVRAEVVEQGRGPKLRVFKKKRRKGYRKTIGHRQAFTAVRITAIEG